MHIL
ncbi:hypothetical protein D030_4035A, partial [Vibrio parahaemolyticus AQ3810]|jgi:hypothetical protein